MSQGPMSSLPDAPRPAVRALRARALAAALLVAIVLLIPMPRATRMLGALEDLGHVALGGFLALVLAAPFSQGRPSRARSIVAAALAASAFLGVLEIVQPFFSRDGNVSDAMTGAAGAFTTACFLVAMHAASHRGARAAALLAAGILLVGACWDPVHRILDRWDQLRQFPSLGSFESSSELGWWSGGDAEIREVREHATEGARSLRIALRPGKYPGVALPEPPEDWRGYSELRAEAFLEGDADLELTVRITDAEHDGRYADRFNGAWHLRPGENHLRVPLSVVRKAPHGRELDLGRVRDLVIFAVDLATPRTFYLDDVRLVPEAHAPLR